MRVTSLLSAVLWLALSIPALAQEAVGASRYRERLSTYLDAGTVLDQAALEDRCRDEDGCEVTLVISDPIGYQAARGRIFLDPLALRWINLAGDPQISGDSTVQTAASVANFLGDCVFNDADDTGGTVDTTPAFSLHLHMESLESGSCVLTVID